jgi:hypothetical protein
MSSYDKELAEENKLKIDVVINQIILTMINLGINTKNIAAEVVERNPKILEDDERLTGERERIERNEYIRKKSGDFSESYKEEVRKEAIETINKMRIPTAFNELDSFVRMAYNLIINFDDSRPNGYHWSKFYTIESDEPFKESTVRLACEDENNRTKYRHITVCNFIAYSYKYWPMIRESNLDFLVNHFSTIFPDSDFTDKIQIIYGKNEEKKNYVSQEDMDVIWRYLHGLVRLCIKYMYLNDRTSFSKLSFSDGPKDIVEVDYHNCISEWDAKLTVKVDNLSMWNDIK